MKRLELNLPLHVMLPRKTKADKKIALNLNTTRNLHYQVMNQSKVIFKKIVEHILEETNQSNVKFDRPVEISWKIYKPTNRRLDKHNCISVIEKFTMDALVELGILEDDNDDFVKTEILLPTELDRKNPRCVMIMSEVDNE